MPLAGLALIWQWIAVPPLPPERQRRAANPLALLMRLPVAAGSCSEGYGLFIGLGSFSRQSVELERNRPKLRLIDGEQFVELVLENYSRLSPRYRTLLPLKQIYVPDLQG